MDERVRVAGLRWAIQEGLAQAKGEVGLDQYEVRGWQAWQRHVTLCLLAHAALAVLCASARRAEEAGVKRGAHVRPGAHRADGPGGAPPHARAGRRRGATGLSARVVALAARPSGRGQAVSQRAPRERATLAAPSVILTLPHGDVSDAEWERVRPLLPPQKPHTGRPRHDHHTVLSGILWVLRSAAPWREMPARFGKWDTAYARYRL